MFSMFSFLHPIYILILKSKSNKIKPPLELLSTHPLTVTFTKEGYMAIYTYTYSYLTSVVGVRDRCTWYLSTWCT